MINKRNSLINIIILLLIVFPRLIFSFLPVKNISFLTEKPFSTVFYDCKNRILQITALEDGSRREYVKYSELPSSVKKIFIKAEDKRFYTHTGTDYIALSNALFQNIKNKKIVRGGSTISMQVIKMINNQNDATFRRKLKDIFKARILEANYSKQYILELYFNNLFFGHGAIGIESAARTFYGTELSKLSEQQVCCLAVLPRNPTYYDPFVNSENCAKRAAELYNSIFHKNISQNDFAAFLPKKTYSYPFEAPHYIRYYEQQYKTQNKSQQLPYKVTLSIDLELQNKAETLVNQGIEEANSSRISNASLLLIENKTGKPIAWVGSANFFDFEHNGQIDGVLVNNQPGSSMKPFLYALALDTKDSQGYNLFSPSSILADIPSEFGEEKLYIPSNFNNRYNGPVRFRIALASSLNIPAVSLLNTLGVPEYLNKLYDLGFTSLRKTGEAADLGLALGAGEVPLIELVPAFSVFARDGKDFNNNQIFSTDTARLICSILSDKGARALGFGYTQTFETDYPSIFKTGTSNQYQNIIALGATKDYSIGVWMGNFNGETVVGKTGSSLPAWIAKNLFDYILEGKTITKEMDFPEPENWVKQKICSLSGLPAGPNCPASVYEYLPKSNQSEYMLKHEQTETCNWHISANDSQEQTLYPPEYQQWARKLRSDINIDYGEIPLQIETPKNNAIFYFSSLNKDRQAVSVEVYGGSEEILFVNYDDEPYATVSRPFSFQLPVEKGSHKCTVYCGDEIQEISFIVK